MQERGKWARQRREQRELHLNVSTACQCPWRWRCSDEYGSAIPLKPSVALRRRAHVNERARLDRDRACAADLPTCCLTRLS